MIRIAPLVGFFLGMDLSAAIIEKNRRLVEVQKHANISLAALPAHRVRECGKDVFHLAILNSVVQSFYDHNYLRQMLADMVELMADNGYLFIGDIMDQDLKENLLTQMLQRKRKHRGSGKTSGTNKTDWSAGLFLSRSFLEDQSAEIPTIRDVRFSGKIYTIENELTRYRYDTLFSLDKNTTLHQPSPGKRKYHADSFAFVHSPAVRLFDGSNPSAGDLQLMYILCKLGTTGTPMGVMLEHRSVLNL